MATATSNSRQVWEARAISLAEEHHLSGTARYIGQGVHGGEALYRVSSQSHDGCYVIQAWPLTQQVLCSCTAGSYGHPCSHAGAAILAERQRQQVVASANDEPLRSFAHGLEW